MMPKTELKPTTREERERWKGGHKYQPTDQSFTILRLIADVDRLERERDEAIADCEVKASYAQIYAANFEQAGAALARQREALEDIEREAHNVNVESLKEIQNFPEYIERLAAEALNAD